VSATALPRKPWPPDWARELGGADLDPTGLYLATEAGCWLPPAVSAGDRRAFALLVLALLEARRAGGTRLPLGTELDGRLGRLEPRADDRSAARALGARLLEEPALAALVGRPGDYRPFIVDGDHLYAERDWRVEERLADALAGRLLAPDFAVPEPIADEPMPAGAAPLARRPWTPTQAAALRAALTRRLTVVSGGPGSGKTALIAGLVRGFRTLGLPLQAIAIAAPTGKAANRIAETLGQDAPCPGTLHRLLGYAPGRARLGGGEFSYHENRRLPHAAVLVDEASMLDLRLLDQLLRALAPDARLVLLGDADQLPAIEAGDVLRDLDPVAFRLVESHRMNPDDPDGADILAAARAVAAGHIHGNGAPPRTRVDELPWRGFACLDAGPATSPRRQLTSFLDRWYETWLRAALDGAAVAPLGALAPGRELEADAAARASAVLDRHARARLLTVTRVGPFGADRVNAMLGDRARRDFGGDAHLPAPGTPVMMTRNDYDRGIMNGDQGVVMPATIDGRGTPVAVFPRDGGLTALPVATLHGAVAVSFATTVHKAQGSELDHAALLLPDADLPLLSRELVYTAITRARRSMTIVGPRALFDAAVGRPLVRSSGLAERLRARHALNASRSPAS
jgi:exodeoxyribonuclease V alpha subunit